MRNFLQIYYYVERGTSCRYIISYVERGMVGEQYLRMYKDFNNCMSVTMYLVNDSEVHRKKTNNNTHV